MEKVSSIWELPPGPAVYALYGVEPAPVPVFVGVADSLLRRIVEQFVVEGGSAESSALSLRPDWIAELRWWEHADFDDPHSLRAAEFAASDLLDPLLRSRARISEQARRLYDDDRFREAMRVLFIAPPAGSLRFPTVSLVIERISRLESRLRALARQMAKATGAVPSGEVSRRVDL